MNKEHEEVTLQKIYQRDVQKIYHRDVQDFYTPTIQDFYARKVEELYQRNILVRYIPLFEKKVSSIEGGTLTSYLGNNPGGKLGNGMVFLEIKTQEAKK